MDPGPTTNPTQSHSLVSAGAAAPEAYRHAPTLMAGEVAGSQGEVQVWSPDTAVLKKHARQAAVSGGIYLAAPLVFGLLVNAAIEGGISYTAFVLSFVLFMIPWLAAGLVSVMRQGAMSAARRPRYLTTDDAGIGVTTQGGSRYFRWDEIAMLSTYSTIGVKLHSRSGEQVILNLSGYTREQQDELVTLIRHRTGLAPLKAWWWVGGGLYALPGYRGSMTSGKLLPPTRAALAAAVDDSPAL